MLLPRFASQYQSPAPGLLPRKCPVKYDDIGWSSNLACQWSKLQHYSDIPHYLHQHHKKILCSSEESKEKNNLFFVEEIKESKWSDLPVSISIKPICWPGSKIHSWISIESESISIDLDIGPIWRDYPDLYNHWISKIVLSFSFTPRHSHQPEYCLCWPLESLQRGRIMLG